MRGTTTSSAAVLSGRRWPLWALLAVPPAVFAALAPFAHPYCDDYTFAASFMLRGFWDSEKAWYLGWTGRYTGIAVQLLFPWGFDLVRHYAAVPLLMIAGVAASACGVALAGNRALGWPLSRRAALAAGLGFASLYFAQMPSPAESLYWLAAAGSYMVPMIAAGGMLACPLAVRRGDSWRASALAAPAAAVLAFIAAGGTESYLPPLGTILVVATAVAFVRRHPSRWVWAAALAGFAAGAAVVAFAPGNAQRMDHFRKSPWRALANTTPRVLLWAPKMPMAIGVTVLALPALQSLARRLGWAGRARWRHVGWMAAAGPGLVVLTLAPAVCLGLVPPPRVLNGAYVFFLAGWFATAVAWVATWRDGPRPSVGRPLLLRGGYALVLVGCLAGSNVPWAVCDLALRAGEYDRQLQARYAALRADPQPGKDSCALEPLDVLPRTIRPGNRDDDRDALRYVRYYFALEASGHTLR